MSVQELASSLKNAVNNRIAQEARALRGRIINGKFQCGAKSYPYKQAADCNIADRRKVWAQRSNDGKAIIIGA